MQITSQYCWSGIVHGLILLTSPQPALQTLSEIHFYPVGWLGFSPLTFVSVYNLFRVLVSCVCMSTLIILCILTYLCFLWIFHSVLLLLLNYPSVIELERLKLDSPCTCPASLTQSQNLSVLPPKFLPSVYWLPRLCYGWVLSYNASLTGIVFLCPALSFSLIKWSNLDFTLHFARWQIRIFLSGYNFIICPTGSPWLC